MTKRLTSITKSTAPQYAAGSPLLLTAHALYLDNVTKQCVAQLKLRNVGEKRIIAASVELTCFDVFKHEVARASFSYDSLAVDVGGFFGNRTAILLPNGTITSFDVSLKAIAYADGSILEPPTPVTYQPLPEAKPNALQGEMLEQYKRDLVQQDIRTNVAYEIQNVDGLWQCVCGSWQQEGQFCFACEATQEALIEATDPEQLEIHLQEHQEAVEVARKNDIYQQARSKMDQRTEEGYVAAIKLLESILGWKDADELVFVCQQERQELKVKEEAELQARERAREQAQQKRNAEMEAMRQTRERAEEQARLQAAEKARKREMRKKVFIILMVLAVAALFVTAKHIINQNYDAAVTLMNEGKYADAYNAFVSLGRHKDSVEKANAILNEHPQIEYAMAKVGSYVTFGTYEQDANTSNGKEAIEWRVLAKESNRLLVISRYALDCQPYNDKDTDVIWKTCTLRKWLNNDFLNAAFSSTEQVLIFDATVSADKNPDYSTNPGNATQDKVFLLSIPEANKYFTPYSARQCKPTAYAKKQGADTWGDFCWWWLRSPGDAQNSVAYVSYEGHIGESGWCVNDGSNAVRPALWINLTP